MTPLLAARMRASTGSVVGRRAGVDAGVTAALSAEDMAPAATNVAAVVAIEETVTVSPPSRTVIGKSSDAVVHRYTFGSNAILMPVGVSAPRIAASSSPARRPRIGLVSAVVSARAPMAHGW